MTIPSIKGTAYLSAHADVNALLTGGAITRDEIEVALEADDLRLLDEKVQPTAWYPIASYHRLLQLLCDKEAQGDVQAYLIGRGEKAGERIAATGIYQQLDTTAERLGVRTGRIVITVAGLIYNFTTWHFEREGATVGNFSIRVDEATDFPEAARFTTQGFIQNASARIVGRPMLATSERPLPSRILFHVSNAR
jgi:hypothetical protein